MRAHWLVLVLHLGISSASLSCAGPSLHQRILASDLVLEASLVSRSRVQHGEYYATFRIDKLIHVSTITPYTQTVLPCVPILNSKQNLFNISTNISIPVPFYQQNTDYEQSQQTGSGSLGIVSFREIISKSAKLYLI